MRKIKILFFSLAALSLLTVFPGCKKKTSAKVEVITLFSNLPDRNHGQGRLEQILIDNYMEENPGVTIRVETLDEDAYKTKFKVYCTERMPDIVSVWGQRAFMQEAAEAGVFLELNPEDYKDYGFIEGSLEGFTYNGKLYGLPRNTDMAVFFYNEHMFQDYRWKIPQTFSDLLEIAKDANIRGKVAVAMDGSDGWPLMMYLSNILQSLSGSDYSNLVQKMVHDADFSDSRIRKALEYFVQSCEEGLFQKNFTVSDYGAAQNLFLSYTAAMFYMGSWECSMPMNETYWNEITPYIRVLTLPPFPESKNDGTVFGWYGGGYAVSADAKNKKHVIDFFNYIFKQENLSRIGLENAVGLSAQNEKEFIKEQMPETLSKLVEISSQAKSFSGSPINDMGSGKFKIVSEREIQKLASGQISIEEFIRRIKEECGE